VRWVLQNCTCRTFSTNASWNSKDALWDSVTAKLPRVLTGVPLEKGKETAGGIPLPQGISTK